MGAPSRRGVKTVLMLTDCPGPAVPGRLAEVAARVCRDRARTRERECSILDLGVRSGRAQVTVATATIATIRRRGCARRVNRRAFRPSGLPARISSRGVEDAEQFAVPIDVRVAAAAAGDRQCAAEARVGAGRVAQPCVRPTADRCRPAVNREARRDDRFAVVDEVAPAPCRELSRSPALRRSFPSRRW